MAAGKFMRHAAIMLAALAPISASVPAMAQSEGRSLHAGTLEVALNKSQIISTDRPIARAMIGNADIADILPVTDRSIYVLGKNFGTTSLTLYDSGGRVLTIMDVAVGPDVDGFRDQVEMLIPGQDIDAHISGGSMVLTGLVSDPGAIDRAMQLAGTYAGDRVVNLISLGSSQQVMLEVKFAEINKSAGKELGFRLLGGNDSGNFGTVIGPGATANAAFPVIDGLNLDEINNSFGVAGRTGIGLFGLTIDAYVEALEAKGFAKTLANPTLIALSGQTASFLAGGEFPVPVVQNSDSDAISVQFKPFGVSLGFTPTVLGDKVINLIVEPEVSSIDANASVVLGGLNIPGIQTRRASTTLELRDGESFAIAGLIQQDLSTSVSQVPLLGSLPIIGSLFRSTQFQKGETELLIVVTPRLVAPIKPEQVRLPTDAVKDTNELDLFLNGRTHEMRDPAPDTNSAAVVSDGDDYEY